MYRYMNAIITPKLLGRSLLLALAFTVAFIAAYSAAPAEPQTNISPVPITALATVLGPSFTAPPVIGKDDVVAHVKGQVANITAWNQAQGDRRGLYLAILIDDGADVGPRLQELRHFVQTQSPSTSIGIFYASNGSTLTAAPFSTNHEMVANKVRITFGATNASTSVYLSLIDVIKKLQPVTGRREILLISDGHDPLRGDLEDPDVDRVVSDAEKTGIVIHTLYTRVGRRLRPASFRQSLAQGNLIKVSSGSGGQSFFQGLETPVSYTPFLNQLDMVLHNQYFLTFNTTGSTKKKGEFRSLKVTTEQRNVAITVQSDVFVPGQ
jgi:hypothetical protein